MTPFGIRKKLRNLVHRSHQEAIERFDVTMIVPDGTEHTVQAEKHYTLVMASQAMPKPINTGCPDGSCGTCRVEVVDGRGLSPMKDKEREVVQQWIKDRTDATRLACHARVMGPGVKVKVYNLFDIASVTGP